MKQIVRPNIIRGGQAIPLGNNFYYMKGRKHTAGGIDIGKDLEVEGGEVMQMGGKDIKVFSSLPFLNGKSPAERVMNGENANQVFNAQENFKKVNRIKDDGTKYRKGGKYITKLSPKEEAEFQNWYAETAKNKGLNLNPDAVGQDYDYRGYWKDNRFDATLMKYGYKDSHFTDRYKQPNHPTFSNESKYDDGTGGSWDDNIFIPSISQTGQNNRRERYLTDTGEGYFNGQENVFPKSNKKRFDNGGKVTGKELLLDTIKLLDPTGISSWGDAKRSIDNYKDKLAKNGFIGSIGALENMARETLSAVPMIGKVSKIGKAIKLGNKIIKATRAITKSNNATDVAKIAVHASKLLGKSNKLNKATDRLGYATKITNKLPKVIGDADMKFNNGEFIKRQAYKFAKNSEGDTSPLNILSTIDPSEYEYTGFYNDNYNPNQFKPTNNKNGSIPKLFLYGDTTNINKYKGDNLVINGDTVKLPHYSVPIYDKDKVNINKNAKNLIEDNSGKIFSIDNANMDYHHFDKDVADVGNASMSIKGDKIKFFDITDFGDDFVQKAFQFASRPTNKYPNSGVHVIVDEKPINYVNDNTDNTLIKYLSDTNNKTKNFKHNLKEINMNKKSNGGVYTLTNNGKTRLMFSPSTGEQLLSNRNNDDNLVKSEFGLNIKKTNIGINADWKNYAKKGYTTSGKRIRYKGADGKIYNSKQEAKIASANYNKKQAFEKLQKDTKTKVGLNIKKTNIGIVPPKANKTPSFKIDVESVMKGHNLKVRRDKGVKDMMSFVGLDTRPIRIGVKTNNPKIGISTNYLDYLKNNQSNDETNANDATTGSKPIILYPGIDTNIINTNKTSKKNTPVKKRKVNKDRVKQAKTISSIRNLNIDANKMNTGASFARPIKANISTKLNINKEPITKVVPQTVDDTYSLLPTNKPNVYRPIENDKEAVPYNRLVDENGNPIMRMGGNVRQKAELGKQKKLTPSQRKVANSLSFNSGVNANPEELVPFMTRINRESTINPKPTIAPNITREDIIGKYKFPSLNKDGSVPKDYVSKTPESKKTSLFKNNTTADLVGAGLGAVGSLASTLINANAISKQSYSPAPVSKIANKLKTKVNVNPQVAAVNNNLAESNRLIDANTGSSKVALARKQSALTNASNQLAGIYSNKENQETQLINQDRLNQQSVANQNIDAQNQWAAGERDFLNKRAMASAENYVSLVSNMGAIGQDLLSRPEKRESERNNLIAIMAANPNVNPKYLRALGATWVTDEMITNWEKANKK